MPILKNRMHLCGDDSRQPGTLHSAMATTTSTSAISPPAGVPTLPLLVRNRATAMRVDGAANRADIWGGGPQQEQAKVDRRVGRSKNRFESPTRVDY